MTLVLRDYQEDALTALEATLKGQPRGTGSGVKNRPALLMATGGGKTAVAAALLADPARFTAPARCRRLFLVHRDELAQQAVRHLHSANPNLTVGRVQAHHNDTSADIVVASVPTLANPLRRAQIENVGILGADECHHSVADTWLAVLEHYGSWRGLPTIGFTATLSRTDVAAGKHLGHVWQEVPFRWTIKDGILGGWLVDVRGQRIKVKGLALDSIRKTAGDLQAGHLGEQLHEAGAPEQVVEGWFKFGQLRSTIAFTPTVPVAFELAEAFTAAGVACDVVTGNTPAGDEETDAWDANTRAAIFRRSRHYAEQGTPHILINCMVLTEGFDAPHLSCAIIMRATKSPGLYVQMVGRILRLWRNPSTGEVKADALILDVGGASDHNRLASPSDLDMDIADVAEGESLREAAERAEGEAQPDDKEPTPEGEVFGRAFDPFAESNAMWSETALGYSYIATKNWIRFLAPQPNGLYAIQVVENKPVHQSPLQGPADMLLEYAMSHVEAISLKYEPSLASKGAAWRKGGGGVATDAQRGKARRLGVVLPAGCTKSEAADMITGAIANMAIHGPRSQWGRR